MHSTLVLGNVFVFDLKALYICLIPANLLRYIMIDTAFTPSTATYSTWSDKRWRCISIDFVYHSKMLLHHLLGPKLVYIDGDYPQYVRSRSYKSLLISVW